MWAIPTGASWLLKKKKSPSPESRLPETGSDPPIGSDRDSGRDKEGGSISFQHHSGIGLCSKISFPMMPSFNVLTSTYDLIFFIGFGY